MATVVWAWRIMTPQWRASAVITACIVMVLQVFNELLSLHVFHAWDFSQEHNRLVGVDLWGAPIEEYLFWFAFAWFVPFLYSGLCVVVKCNRR
jgi:hypothetical protein